MSLRVLITGAGRGLGLEFVRQYLTAGAQVYAAARAPRVGKLARLAEDYAGRLTLIELDVGSEPQLQAAVVTVQKQTAALDLLINNAAINLRGIGLGSYEREAMLQVLHVNAVAPILIGQAFRGLLDKGTAPKVVNLSSQVGSFSWNKSGSSPLYAASKAALNMYTRSFAREGAPIITIAVHPGWVQTDMGGASAPLTPAQAVEQLRTLIARLAPADNGQFFNYDGRPHPY